MKGFLIFISFFFVFNLANAEQPVLLQDQVHLFKAKVIKVLSSDLKNVPGTDVKSIYQKISAEIIEGEDNGMVVDVENDYLKLSEGEEFYLRQTKNIETGDLYYSVDEPYRLKALSVISIIFIIIVLIVGGIQGIRGLLSLGGSLLVILYFLLPSILAGYSPVITSVLVSSFIIILGSYITHGFNKTTSSAVLGMIVTVIFTGIMAFWAVKYTHLSGFGSEESVYLNLNNRGEIDILGILLSGIIIGLLGVLYDVAIGQSVAVEELHRIAPDITRAKIFSRAIRIGREHIGALVNTLAIAYVGASLPLLLLFSGSESPLGVIINKELFATEIVRTLVGSIGLVLAVPITTFISVIMVVKPGHSKKEAESKLDKIHPNIDHVGHFH